MAAKGERAPVRANWDELPMEEGKIESPGAATSSVAVGKLLFPSTKGLMIMACRFRYVTKVFKVGAEFVES